MPEEDKKVSLPWFGIPKVIPYLKGFGPSFRKMAVFCLLGSALDILQPVYQRYAINHFVADKTLDTLLWYILIYLGTILLTAGFNFICLREAMRVEVSINRELRSSAFTHLQALSFSYYNQNSVGYLHSRVMSDTSRIGELFSWGVMDSVWQITYLIGAVVVMLVVNARLALLVILIIPLIVVLFSLFQSKLVRLNREVREINSRITGQFNEGITGAATIKTLAVEKTVEKDFTAETEKMKNKSVKAACVRGLFSSTISFASSLAIALVLWQGGILAAEEIGTFSLFMSYAEGMMEPIRWLIDTISEMIMTQVNIERLTRLIETRPDVTDTPEVEAVYGNAFEAKRENWEELKGDIRFENVSFRYPDGEEMILEHFSLHIPFGSNIAIVGETGAGKSTLVNLICRFYEPTEGRILIDGRDARERSQLWLHSSIGYVLQTPHLFSGTVRENLLYGNPDATEEAIDRALELVAAKDVVAKLENGLDTDVGEGGNLLSTGEKQLISFARAILADPRILILDEATSSVDTITEQKIQTAIETVIRGRTSIVIAHRLSTIRNADRILAVRDGKIVEQGTHSELMALHGYYRELYTRQYEEEAVESVLG